MSLATRLSDAFARVGTEVKAVRDLANSKYTKPAGGIPWADLGDDLKYDSLEKGVRWEQEILVQSGTRTAGSGPAPVGINFPFNVRITGVRYFFETATTSGATTGKLIISKTTDFPTASQMNIAANATSQIITGLAVDISANQRVSCDILSAGTSGIGKGLYVSLWGYYR